MESPAPYTTAPPADDEASHPNYGPCDAMGTAGRCYECARQRGDAPAPLTPAQALRDDVRRKYRDALPGTAQAARWFRLEELLDLSDAEARASAAQNCSTCRQPLWQDAPSDAPYCIECPAPPADAVLFPAGPWTEGQEASRQQLQLDCFALKKRVVAAEARVQELLAELADRVEQLTGSNEWAEQLTARAEKAEARAKEERTEADRFQVQVPGLVRRELDLLRQIAELKEQIKPELTGNAAAYEIIRQQMARRCAKCAGVVNAYGQCLHCDTTEPGLCN